MAKYKPYTTKQGTFAAVFLEDQLQPGTFEHTLNYLIEQELDLAFFDSRYRNDDDTGAPAYEPKILLKIILFAYSRGITSSRKIAQCCKENLVLYFHGRSEAGKTTFSEKMKKKIDSTAGRLIYSLRGGVVEPPFSHICQVMGLNRFSHRGKKKVNTQWNLFTIVHNMKKIHRYGLGFA